MQRTMKLPELLSLAADHLAQPIRRAWLDFQINQHYINREYFINQMKESQHNLMWTDKRLAILESDRRAL